MTKNVVVVNWSLESSFNLKNIHLSTNLLRTSLWTCIMQYRRFMLSNSIRIGEVNTSSFIYLDEIIMYFILKTCIIDWVSFEIYATYFYSFYSSYNYPGGKTCWQVCSYLLHLYFLQFYFSDFFDFLKLVFSWC